ncbi:MAG: hypothetical protein AAF985_01320 [Bacteroidota bacterium]
MKPTHKFMSVKTLVIFSLLLIGYVLPAQNQLDDICEEGDCSETIFAIPLDAPLAYNPSGTSNTQRTEQYKRAYTLVKQLKTGYQQKSDWQQKYNALQLGGKSCLRLYQLEGFFAYEYLQNPAFKSFVDQQESNVNAFKEKGFESSRRAMNLSKRMGNFCPRELKKLEKKAGPSQKDMPSVYTKLGIEQGYFDKDGNVLKAIPQLAPQQTTAKKAKPKKLSKRKQVAQLKENLAQLPLGINTQTKLADLSNGLSAAKPKLGLFGRLFKGIKSVFSGLFPKPKKLLSKLGDLKGVQDALKGFTPKIPNPDLLSKVNDLIKDRGALIQKAEGLTNKANTLKGLIDQLSDKKDGVEKDLTQQSDKISDLQNQLNDLVNRKNDLANRLENRPKKHLEELKQISSSLNNDTNGLLEALKKGGDLKDQLLSKLDQLNSAKDDIEKQVNNLEDVAELLNDQFSNLTGKTDDVTKWVDQIKAEEAIQAAKEKAIDELKQKLADLAPELPWEKEIKICKDDLGKLLNKINPLKDLQNTFKDQLEKLKSGPEKLLGKIGGLKDWQNKLKLGKKGIPILGSTLGKIDQLLAKGNALGSTVEAITGKRIPLLDKVNDIDQKIKNLQTAYEEKVDQIDELQNKLSSLISEKTDLQKMLDQQLEKVEPAQAKVDRFIEQYNIFGDEEKCIGIDDLNDAIEKIKNTQDATEPEIEELENELDESSKAEEKLQEETQTVEEEIDEHTEKEVELQEEAKSIEEEFGKKIELETVPVETWVESFEIKRPYWEAVFHPDDEVVKGYKGRYFQVQLKDADKNVKLLFGPGEYYMDKADFRDNYGSTIGAFVTETLNAMKKSDRSKIQLFVQGSADIVGQQTFRGKLDQNYYYEAVTVLPVDGEGEGFLSDPSTLEIPVKGFRNTDLPNLRGNFLREMIGIYSKKLQPVLLEGQVKDVANKDDRNAVIYLFIPETLVEEYEGR